MGTVMGIEILIGIIGAFLVALLTGPIIIPVLRKLKFGQTVRDEGPESHLKKSGTPTMGGVIFLLGVTVVSVFFLDKYPAVAPVLALTAAMGMIGFLDDYIKVVLKRSLGLRAWQKMLLQFITTAAFCFYIVVILHSDLTMKIPFFKDCYLDLGLFNIPLLFIVIIGTTNATNLTDGVDGLASSVTAVVAAFFCIVAIIQGNTVAPVAAAFTGGLLGFLMFNVYPAKVFMGDTGSLALGGFVASTAYVLHMPLFLLIVGIIYVAETVSVMLQVSYFKITHGKRIFRMAPLHHHFELGGWSEAKVVAVFTIVTLLGALICLYGIW